MGNSELVFLALAPALACKKARCFLAIADIGSMLAGARLLTPVEGASSSSRVMQTILLDESALQGREKESESNLYYVITRLQ